MSFSDVRDKPAERQGRRLTTAAGVVVTLLSACLVAAVLGSGPLLDWADDLSDRTGFDAPREAAQAWHDGLAKLGLTKGYAVVRQQVRAAEQTGFQPADGN